MICFKYLPQSWHKVGILNRCKKVHCTCKKIYFRFVHTHWSPFSKKLTAHSWTGPWEAGPEESWAGPRWAATAGAGRGGTCRTVAPPPPCRSERAEWSPSPSRRVPVPRPHANAGWTACSLNNKGDQIRPIQVFSITWLLLCSQNLFVNEYHLKPTRAGLAGLTHESVAVMMIHVPATCRRLNKYKYQIDLHWTRLINDQS